MESKHEIPDITRKPFECDSAYEARLIASYIVLRDNYHSLEAALKEIPEKVLDVMGAISDEELTIEQMLAFLRQKKQQRDEWETYAHEIVSQLQSQLAEARSQIEALTSKLARFKQPIVYHLRDYPETCPSCGDRHRLISNGPDGFVCYACWLLQELEQAEAQLADYGKPSHKESRDAND